MHRAVILPRICGILTLICLANVECLSINYEKRSL